MKKYNKYKSFCLGAGLLLGSTLYGGGELVFNNFMNLGLGDAKNAIMGGATTATAKGYSSMFSNPAGLSTNHNITLYTRTIYVERKDDNGGNTIKEYKPENQIAAGLLYNYVGIEYKLDDYVMAGLGYGVESDYGMFSLGVSYLADLTDITKLDEVADNEFATGDYLTAGFMWQKTFLSSEDFYTVYFGVAQKASGEYTGSKDVELGLVSPEKLSYGLGLETNIFSTSVLVTIDSYTKKFKSSDATVDGLAYGAKWMIWEKFALAGGMCNETYSQAGNLDSVDSFGGGVEFGLWLFHFNTAYLNRTINSKDGNANLKEDSIHLDISMVF